MTLADQIDALLPQTQCTKCGYPACRPYAEAIARGEAQINQCPPGGSDGITKLAALLGREVLPLNPANGAERDRTAALIDESLCIGCTLCIQACPVDAIVGAPKLMHTVLLQHCTGCDLCIPPCPMDCIAMVELGELARRRSPIARRNSVSPRRARATHFTRCGVLSAPLESPRGRRTRSSAWMSRMRRTTCGANGKRYGPRWSARAHAARKKLELADAETAHASLQRTSQLLEMASGSGGLLNGRAIGFRFLRDAVHVA
jgi:electron transport complex protein RnfB